ncbi:hypothetical protein QR680_018912 [Steinernema hermaphroditum]|uniref:Uncharacterized protein n=1 Tax=Steinernema hermaphroditum TaxID=289476 RepID=A0AA39HJE3_9BILA|nr:hypothetical protein QR680_018912 [Steinernema hermaphroditum]
MVLLSNFASIPFMYADFVIAAALLVMLPTILLVSCSKESVRERFSGGSRSRELDSAETWTDRSKPKSPENDPSTKRVHSPVKSSFEGESSPWEKSQMSRRSDRDTITEEIWIPLGKTSKDQLPSSVMTSRLNLKVNRKPSPTPSLNKTRAVTFGAVRKVKSRDSLMHSTSMSSRGAFCVSPQY